MASLPQYDIITVDSLKDDLILISADPFKGVSTVRVSDRGSSTGNYDVYSYTDKLEGHIQDYDDNGNPVERDNALITAKAVVDSLATKSPSEHSHNISDFDEFQGWKIEQNSLGDTTFNTKLPTEWVEVDPEFYEPDTHLYDVCYGKDTSGSGIFLTVCDNDLFMYSYDGDDWIDGGFILDSFVPNAVCYGNGVFVAAGENGKIAFSSENDIYDWYLVGNSPFGTVAINDVCYGEGIFVAVGNSGKTAISLDNGYSWTALDNIFSVSYFPSMQSVCYGDGKFIATGVNGEIFSYSYGSSGWTQIYALYTSSKPIFKNAIIDVCYGNGKYIAVGNSELAYSYIGNCWNLVSNSVLPASMRICYGNGKYIASGLDGTVVYSLDGVNWTKVDNLQFGGTTTGICYGDGVYVAVNSNGKIYYSTCW